MLLEHNATLVVVDVAQEGLTVRVRDRGKTEPLIVTVPDPRPAGELVGGGLHHLDQAPVLVVVVPPGPAGVVPNFDDPAPIEGDSHSAIQGIGHTDRLFRVLERESVPVSIFDG